MISIHAFRRECDVKSWQREKRETVVDSIHAFRRECDVQSPNKRTSGQDRCHFNPRIPQECDVNECESIGENQMAFNPRIPQECDHEDTHNNENSLIHAFRRNATGMDMMLNGKFQSTHSAGNATLSKFTKFGLSKFNPRIPQGMRRIKSRKNSSVLEGNAFRRNATLSPIGLTKSEPIHAFRRECDILGLIGKIDFQEFD